MQRLSVREGEVRQKRTQVQLKTRNCRNDEGRNSTRGRQTKAECVHNLGRTEQAARHEATKEKNFFRSGPSLATSLVIVTTLNFSSSVGRISLGGTQHRGRRLWIRSGQLLISKSSSRLSISRTGFSAR